MPQETPTTLTAKTPSRYSFSPLWRVVRRIPLTAKLGILVVSVYLIAAIFAPWIAPYGEFEVVSDIPYAAPSARIGWAPISLAAICCPGSYSARATRSGSRWSPR